MWFLITLLKGEAYSCSYWPDANQLCPGTNQTYAEPCKQPKTVGDGVSLDSCDAKMARNLKAESHMIGWCLVFCTSVFLTQIAYINVRYVLARNNWYHLQNVDKSIFVLSEYVGGCL